MKFKNKHFGLDIFGLVVVGFFLGLVVAYIVWSVYRYGVVYFSYPIHEVYYNDVVETNVQPLTMALDISEEAPLVNTPTFDITGTISQKAVIIVSGGIETVSTETDENGLFSLEVPLEEGINELSITAFSQRGEKIQETRTILYSQESQVVEEE